MATLKKDQYQLNAKSGSSAGIFGANWIAQTFEPSVSGDLEKVYLSLNKFGSPTVNLEVAIRATTAGVPSGSDLASESFAHGSISTSPSGNLVVTFSSPPTLVSGTRYAIIVRSPSATNPNIYNWQYSKSFSGTANYYADGQVYLSSDSGSTWPTAHTSDAAFVTEMSIAVATPGLDIHIFGDDSAGVTTGAGVSDEFAQTFEPTISADLKQVIISLTRAASQSGGTVTIEVQETNVSDEPNGSVLASETLADASISEHSDNTDIAIQTIVFSSPPSLLAGTRYAIVLKFPDNGGGGSYRIATSQSVDQYPDGERLDSTDSGSSWTPASNDLVLGTFMMEPVTTTQTIDSDTTVQAEATQTIDSDAFVGEETIKTIDSDTDILAEISQTIDADAQIGISTEQTIDSDSHVEAESTETIDSNANINAEVSKTIDANANVSSVTSKQISAGAFVSTPVTKTIQSSASITVNNPELKLFASTAPTVEVGTPTNPIIFSGVLAGEDFEHPDNPFYLWNDKGAVIESVDAREIVLKVVALSLTDELLGNSSGAIDQTFATAFSPVIEDNEIDHPVSVKVNGFTWLQVDTLATTSGTDEVYEFDYSTGTITFGDGVNGKVPPVGNTIEISYTPQTVDNGFEVEQANWLGIRSNDVISNTVTATLERQISLDASTVQVSRQNISSVTSVFLGTDPNGLGTDYFAGGSFDANTGILTLGTPLPGLNTDVLVTYSYAIVDDAEADFTQIGAETSHEFNSPIPRNNAKQIFLRLSPPADASPSGVMNISFKIQIDFKS